jgi:hypothetical protein
LRIQTDGIIPVDQIRVWAGVQRGDNLLALDLNRIKRDLELVPLIESASVERYLPRELVVHVQEREPIARVIVFQPRPGDGFLEPNSFFLDQDGMVIPPEARALNPRAFDLATHLLPNLIGVRPEELRPGNKVSRELVLASLRFLTGFRASEMAGHADLRSVDLSSGNTLLVTTDQGGEITFAPRDFGIQLARWRRIHDFGGRESRLIASLDLAVTNYVPVSWVNPTNAAPAALRQSQPSPYRKRHV